MSEDDAPRPSVLRVDGHFEIASPTVEKRLQTIEAKLDKGDSKGALAWILDVLKTLLPSIVLAVLGFALKDSVDQALRQKEIQLAAVKEMKALVPDLQKTDLDIDQAEARAAQLAAYGRYSVPFFINILEVGNEYAQEGAEDGLRMVARSEPDPVCATLQSVIRNRTGLYKWQTHLAALKVLGEASCIQTCPDLLDFRKGLASLDEYKGRVSSAPLPTEFDKVSKQAAATVAKLNGLKQSACK